MMADPTTAVPSPPSPRRASALSHLTAGGPKATSQPAATVSLREVPYLARVNLRLDPSGTAARRVAAVLGSPLPVEPNTVRAAAEYETLWLGPDEWLVVGPDGSQERLVEQLRAAAGDAVASVVDVSAQWTTVEVAGARARDVLAKGCPLDLHPRAFGTGQCAQTLLARAGVLILARDSEEPRFWLFVRPTFADYVARWLLDACAEYGCHGLSR